MNKCPCTRDCPERSGTCRFTCQRHKDWEREHRAELAEKNRKKAVESGIVEHLVRVSDRVNRRNK